MRVITLPLGPLETNCYIVADPDSGEAAIIDPAWSAATILDNIRRNGLSVRYVLNTHAHWDHIAANAGVVEATGAPLGLHPRDLPLLMANGGADWMGVTGIRPSPEPTLELKAGVELPLGAYKLIVLFTPGHTPGHVAFYEESAGVVFTGDALFKRGIGRTDLPGGDPDALHRSLHDVLMALPASTLVYPGHGPMTNIGDERKYNPFLSGAIRW